MGWIWKAVGLGAVALGLVAVLGSVNGLVRERQWRQEQAQQEVAQSTASEQRLGAPYLRRVCTETYSVIVVATDGKKEERRKQRASKEHRVRLAASQVRVQADLVPSTLERGLFKVQTYQAQLQLQAGFDELSALQPVSKELEGEMQCQAPELVIGVTDARGLRKAVLRMNGTALRARPGTGGGDAGLHAPFSMPEKGEPLRLQAELELLGTDHFAMQPTAAQFEATLRSSWPHPSFQGRFLPNEREVSEQGFSATWRITELASNAVAALQAGETSKDEFGVALIDPINPYSLSDRAVKYGFLFILLTLAAVLLAELLGRHRLHPVQYGFAGLSMALFFLLLLALSEHLAFAWAYLVASAASTALLGHYASGLFGSWKAGAGFAALVGLLYGSLYVVLNLEKAALLLGAGLLFVLLAAAMRATRDVNWYALTSKA